MQYTESLEETNVYREDGDMSQSRHSLVFAYVPYFSIDNARVIYTKKV